MKLFHIFGNTLKLDILLIIINNNKDFKKKICNISCRGDKSISIYLCIYWAGGPIQGH